ncbi:hypothetical protein FAZ95_37255 [Trinickia violacea]|uniref:Signal peptidase n=1 Tax=Trinickia violacea TaxID=2571746 RepID=A0A4P8J2Y6_9BURK|nr:hypothetical protein [Trinickia violacea]QCP54533.1 hypothetical protein FAZ95_37255 [Trinickia violacea]
MQKKIAVAALAGLFSLAVFAQASNPQAAPSQDATMDSTPMASPAPAPVKHKHHHRHHHHHKAAASDASPS